MGFAVCESQWVHRRHRTEWLERARSHRERWGWCRASIRSCQVGMLPLHLGDQCADVLRLSPIYDQERIVQIDDRDVVEADQRDGTTGFGPDDAVGRVLNHDLSIETILVDVPGDELGKAIPVADIRPSHLDWNDNELFDGFHQALIDCSDWQIEPGALD